MGSCLKDHKNEILHSRWTSHFWIWLSNLLSTSMYTWEWGQEASHLQISIRPNMIPLSILISIRRADVCSLFPTILTHPTCTKLLSYTNARVALNTVSLKKTLKHPIKCSWDMPLWELGAKTAVPLVQQFLFAHDWDWE